MSGFKYLVPIFILIFLNKVGFSQNGLIEGNPEIAYWVLGESDPIVIVINGGPGLDHSYLQPEWDTLALFSKIVYYDQRGCGESGKSDNYSWIEHLKDLKRVKDYLSPGKKVIIAGSSWGTYLGLLFSIYFPEDVKGLILSGFPFWRGNNFKMIDLNTYHLDSINNFKRIRPISYLSDSIVKSKMESSGYFHTVRTKPEMMDPGLSIRFHHYSEVYVQTFASQPSMPDITYFSEIKVPALIIRGNLYCGYPDWSDVIAKLIEGSELYTILNSCHDPWYSNKNIFFGKCIEFINRVKD